MASLVSDLMNKHEDMFLIESTKHFCKSLWKRASVNCCKCKCIIQYGELAATTVELGEI